MVIWFSRNYGERERARRLTHWYQGAIRTMGAASLTFDRLPVAIQCNRRMPCETQMTMFVRPELAMA